jgi:hypothetical protein
MCISHATTVNHVYYLAPQHCFSLETEPQYPNTWSCKQPPKSEIEDFCTCSLTSWIQFLTQMRSSLCHNKTTIKLQYIAKFYSVTCQSHAEWDRYSHAFSFTTWLTVPVLECGMSTSSLLRLLSVSNHQEVEVLGDSYSILGETSVLSVRSENT